MMSSETTIQLNNLWYYYSTAPQVLGAILAIIGAFAVFNIESLKKQVSVSAQKLVDYAPKERSPMIHWSLIEQFIGKADYNTLKEYVLAQNINDTYDLVKPLLEGINNPIKFPEGEVIEMKGTFQDGQPYDASYAYEEYKYGLGEFQAICNSISSNYENLISFKRSTRNTYIINGLLLLVLISGFFFIPHIPYVIGSIYYHGSILLLAGVIVTAISLSYIIWYIVSALNKKT